MSALKHDIQRIRVDAQGYDSDGAYWGAGPDVFIAISEDGHDQITVRARNLTEAKRRITDEIARKPGEASSERHPLGGNAPRKTRYEIQWRDPASGATIAVRITHARDYLSSGNDHLEIESMKPKKAPLPITETGYRSHFMAPLELMNAGGPVTFVTAWLDTEAKGKGWSKAVTTKAQGDLFSWAETQGEVAKRQSRSKSRSPKPKAPVRSRKPARGTSPENG